MVKRTNPSEDCRPILAAEEAEAHSAAKKNPVRMYRREELTMYQQWITP
jgi:hypothetical protein